MNFYKSAVLSPDYAPKDLVRLYQGMAFTARYLWPAFYSADLFREVPRVSVPVAFFEGRRDFIVPPSVTERYFQALEAPAGKSWVWFEKSAHWPFLEEPEKFHQMLLKVLQP
jgi:pimeloyl-ACP methyl ester carboxylesterase